MPTQPIADLDPVRDPHGSFSPDAPEARAVLACALARGEEPEPALAPRRPRRRGRAVLAGAALAAAVGAFVLGSGGGGALTPEEAIAQAAQRTAQFEAGRVIWSGSSRGTDGYRVEAVNDVRFDGDRVLITSHTDEELPDGSHRLATGDYLQIGRRQWLRAPRGEWREQPPTRTAGGFTERVREEVGDDRLLALVKAAGDVRREDDGAYRGTIGAEQLRALAGPSGRRSGLAAVFPPVGPGETADVTVRVDDESRIRKLVVRSTRYERTVEYAELGEPQAIVAP